MVATAQEFDPAVPPSVRGSDPIDTAWGQAVGDVVKKKQAAWKAAVAQAGAYERPTRRVPVAPPPETAPRTTRAPEQADGPMPLPASARSTGSGWLVGLGTFLVAGLLLFVLVQGVRWVRDSAPAPDYPGVAANPPTRSTTPPAVAAQEAPAPLPTEVANLVVYARNVTVNPAGAEGGSAPDPQAAAPEPAPPAPADVAPPADPQAGGGGDPAPLAEIILPVPTPMPPTPEPPTPVPTFEPNPCGFVGPLAPGEWPPGCPPPAPLPCGPAVGPLLPSQARCGDDAAAIVYGPPAP